MENISKISLNAKVARTNHVDKDQARVKTEKDNRPAHIESDTIDISKETKDFIQMVADLKTAVNEIPDVRMEKIEEVKAKLKDGFYDKPEVVNEVAGKIIDAFGTKGQES